MEPITAQQLLEYLETIPEEQRREMHVSTAEDKVFEVGLSGSGNVHLSVRWEV